MNKIQLTIIKKSYGFVKIIMIALIFSVSLGDVIGQSEEGKEATNTVYLELGGAAGLWSLNYDCTIWKIGESCKLNGRAGLGMLSEFNGAGFPDLLLPISSNFLLGKNKHRIETGLGVTLFNWSLRDSEKASGFTRKTELLQHLNLGYRFQKVDGGIMFRISYTPIIHNDGKQRFEHWMGFSIGKTFKRQNKNTSSI